MAMNFKTQNTFFILLSLLMVGVLFLMNLHNGFFWDTVQLGSEHATYFLNTNFSHILLPDSIDSGHIPGFGMYLAWVWKFFGRNLLNSHLAMLPFVIGIVVQLYQCCIRFLDPKFTGLGLLLLLSDPTLLSQMTLVSPDVPLVFFFLLGFNSVVKNQKALLTCSLFFLFLTSMRGMMLSICLLGLDLHCNVSFVKNAKVLLIRLLQRSVLYIPALLLFLSYNSYHYWVKGWIGYHQNSPWADCFESVDFKGFIFNIGMYGWRLLDFGRIGIWLVLVLLVVVYKNKIALTKTTKLLLWFSIGILVVLPMNMLWAKNLLAPRYLLPIYLIVALLCASLIFSAKIAERAKYGMASGIILILLTGNCWIYPPKIAKGSDASLAHLPYFKLRHQAIQYLDQEKINFKEVTTFFPNVAVIDFIDLNNDSRNFNAYDGKSKYVFYSNLFNIDDETYDKLTSKYQIIKQFKNQGIYVLIFKKPQP